MTSGLPVGVVEHTLAYVVEEPFTRRRVRESLVPPATLKRRKVTLSPEESARFERIARVMAMAESVVESHADAQRFMSGAARMGRWNSPGARRHLLRDVDPAAAPDWDAPGCGRAAPLAMPWLASRASAVLVVPPVVAQPYERNVVIDPTHPDFSRITVHAPEWVACDARLLVE